MIFENLDTYTKIYLLIALISTVVFILKFILMLIAGNQDTVIDGDIQLNDMHVSSDSAFVLLSIESILAFLMGFGWSGIAFRNEWNLASIYSVPLAFIFGFIMMFFFAYLMMQVKKLNKVSSFDINECKGKIASAYTELKRDKMGQVKINASGKLRFLPAINRSTDIINAFSSVIVTDIEDNYLIVDEYKGE